MRTVEVKVWTNSLGHIEVINTYNEDDALQILREADGCYDDDVVDAIEDATGDFLSINDFYFAHPSYDNRITVVDNGEETVYENALSDRYIDASFLYEYINSDIDFENPTDEMKDEYYYNTGIEISDCLRIVNAEVVEKDGPMPYELFKRIKNKDENIKEDLLVISHFRARLEEPSSNTNKEVCLMRCTDRGKDFICFDIDLEDDEEFDINKLHILGECDWWDDPRLYESLLGIAYILPLHSAILDFVEYNGKIYCHDGNRARARGWGYVDRSEQWALINTDMSDVELD